MSSDCFCSEVTLGKLATLESSQAVRVLSELIGQDFDRHVAAELRILRSIDLSHSAPSDGLEDLVVGELVASLE